MTLLTALEITNNDDVAATFGGPNFIAKKYSGWIVRGEGSRCKPLIITEPVYDSPEEARKAMEDLVKLTRETVKKRLGEEK